MDLYDISFVILTWNSANYLEKCFSSLLEKCKSEDIRCQIVVVDNGSKDGTVGILNEFQGKYGGIVKTILLNSNTGTTYSRNLGLKEANGEVICIIDSDTELGSGSLRQVLEKLINDPSLGILAPKLILPNQQVQTSVKRFPTFLQKLLKIPKAVLGLNVVDADFYKDFPFPNVRDVDTAISACWFFSRSMIAKVGDLDEKIFYAPEDLDYCIRVWRVGLRVIYSPHLIVLHHTQHISHTEPFSKISRSHFIGLIYFFKKHGGWIFRPRFGAIYRDNAGK